MIPDTASISYLDPMEARHAFALKAATLIDVRTPEAHAERHAAGSRNFCVYEVAFLEKIREAFPDLSTALIVYGESAGFKAAEAAYGRLKEAGYENVCVLAGGLDDWDGPVEGSGPAAAAGPVGRLSLLKERSRLRWIGRNLTNQHNGTVDIASGWIQLDQAGLPCGGELVVDMRGIHCEDLTDPAMNSGLIGHLSNADFFKVDTYPEASFRLQSCQPIPGSTPGRPNCTIAGEICVRGVTRNIELAAMVSRVDGGVSFQARLDLDRVGFGAVYGSGSLFERLGMHLVNDLVDIQLIAVFG